MRYSPTIFSALVEPLDRRRFDAIVARRNGDAYDKSFFSWNHLLALIYAQFSDLDSLRALEAGWNANSQHHYHLGCGALDSSTLADANKRRPVAIFRDAFELVAGLLDRQCRTTPLTGPSRVWMTTRCALVMAASTPPILRT